MSLSGWNVKRRETMINQPGNSFLWKGYDISFTPPQTNTIGPAQPFQLYVSDDKLARYNKKPLEYAQNAYNKLQTTRQEQVNKVNEARNRRASLFDSVNTAKKGSLLG